MSQIDDAVVQFLNTVNSGLDVAKSQLPEALEQVVHYTILSSLLWQGFGVLLLVVGVPLGVFLYRKSVNKIEEEIRRGNYSESDQWGLRENAGGLGFTVLLTSSFAGFLFVICNFGWVKPYFAPKMFLLEYIKGLL